mmetsp:Transcript_27906/g.24685  ORF Transcript_27906/g.24685 Transcript_27906/m.24685 type:complete len:106 (-) Transcript_27906:434-751(-)
MLFVNVVIFFVQIDTLLGEMNKDIFEELIKMMLILIMLMLMPMPITVLCQITMKKRKRLIGMDVQDVIQCEKSRKEKSNIGVEHEIDTSELYEINLTIIIMKGVL